MATPTPTLRETLEVLSTAPIPMTFGPGQVLWLAAACKRLGVEWPDIERLAQTVKEMEGNG